MNSGTTGLGSHFPDMLAMLRLHEEKVIKDRRHHLKTYPNCFVAKELIDWLIEHKEASDRETAIKLMQKLADRGIIHHVSNKHPFVDSNLLYQFRMNFRRRRRMMELLNEKSPSSQETHDSPFCLRKQGHDNRKSTSFVSVSPSKEIKIVSAVRRSSMSSCGSSGYFSSSPTLSSSPPVLCNPKSVLKRPVTSEELLTPGAPYARKTFTIVGDAVGWGFVVRGSKPCHIQAVDPSGPAAAAGMKDSKDWKVPSCLPYFHPVLPSSLITSLPSAVNQDSSGNMSISTCLNSGALALVCTL
ncbi:Deptor [Phodopus roborovskii]|uniref:Deptor protein n=1 Tax=Phodopus roborovskii TaxID=109678 RepID=A0AAV0A3V2_PHORO|nr:Deptor [Phodopus roborovskii]